MTVKTKTRAAPRLPAAAPNPPLVVAAEDYRRLAAIGAAAAARLPDAAERLLDEIERAEIVPVLPPDVVGMGSAVRFRDEQTGREHRARLVYPEEADFGDGRISVLTPVGTALIGLARGQSISWETRSGEVRTLTVLDVAHS